MDEALREAKWWHVADEGLGEKPNRIVCDLCPRACRLASDARGFCFVRQNIDGRMVSTTYGRSTGFCIDPIEKKPLNHFYPGSAVLSFGTAGCNLGCKYCQNWTSTKSRQVDAYCETAQPEAVAAAARRLGCRSVAFTYNDPIVWAEYAIDTARACRAVNVKTVAVTSGYISTAARSDFFQWIDAANVDLKGFSEAFYHKFCSARLQPVLDTLVWLRRETDVWLELTNLLIPGCNDSSDELQRMCDWIAERLGPQVPVHFTAFHPDFQMPDTPPTPTETLQMARRTAVQAGLQFVYTGNIRDPHGQGTYCPTCGESVVERDGYRLGSYELDGNRCRHCGAEVAGRFGRGAGGWHDGRQPLRIADYATGAAVTREASHTGEVPNGQQIQEEPTARQPVVAGLFYPGRPAQLSDAVDALIAEAGRHEPHRWAGAMVPHAGWVYSGRLAADVFSRVQFPQQVIIFAPKHRPGGANWAVCPASKWLLPGMDVPGDTQLARALADGVDGFELDAVAHRHEHAVEVQLPLLARMAPRTGVAAVVMHGGEWSQLAACAGQLAAVIERLPQRPLLVISSDMNHYATESETRRLDRLALDRIAALDPQGLLETVQANRISMCGVTPAVVVMETLRRLGCLNRCELVGHTTSGDVSGDTLKVVGYAGVLFD